MYLFEPVNWDYWHVILYGLTFYVIGIWYGRNIWRKK